MRQRKSLSYVQIPPPGKAGKPWNRSSQIYLAKRDFMRRSSKERAAAYQEEVYKIVNDLESMAFPKPKGQVMPS
jgi:hypothetical protein